MLPQPANELLPHAPPMLCIDRLLSVHENGAVAEATLAPGHIMLDEGFLSDAAYVELAAQSAGTMKGYAEKVRGLPVRDGFLASVQDFHVVGQARQGDRLRIEVCLTAQVAEVSLIEAVIVRPEPGGESTVLARGKLKVFSPEPESV